MNGGACVEEMTDGPDLPTDDVETPGWFSQALEGSPSTTDIQVSGVRIAVRMWGDVSQPAIVLVHGGGAHARWWDHIAPLLADRYRVVAADLSGHGDSAWRRSYSVESWADELQAIVEGPLVGPSPVIIGHSMGGVVTTELAARMSSALGGIILLDSEIPPRDSDTSRPEWAAARSRLEPRKYESRTEILNNFRTMPAGSQPPPFIRQHIAENSIRAVEDGWSWKFDPKIFGHDFRHLEDLIPAKCRALFVCGDPGIVSPDLASQIHSALGAAPPPLTVTGASHHMLLDRPLQLLAMLSALLGEWTSAPKADMRPTRDSQPSI